MRVLLAIVTSALMAVFAGCRPSEDHEVAFLVVNGVPLTAGQVKDEVLFRAKMLELAGRPVAEKDFAKWANRTAMELVGNLTNVLLLEGEIARVGLKTLPEDEETALALYNEQLGQKYTSIDQMAEAFGDQAAVFRRQLARSSRLAAYERTYWTHDVSDAMVRQYYLIKTNELQQAERIDSAARVNAEKAYRRLQAGESWLKVAAECSEDKLISPLNANYAKDWIWTGEDAMGMKELAVLLPSMKKGDYTKPMDTIFGMVIVRLVENKKKLYHLSRILFRMANPVNVAGTPELAKKAIADQLKQSANVSTMMRLQQAAKFDYPMGTNFCYQIWQEEEQAKDQGK